VMDTRIKASFGTAIKLYDYKHVGHSIAMIVAAVVVFMFTPPAKVFLENVSSRHLWTNLNKRLLPQDRWFGGMAWLVDGVPAKKAEPVMPASASQISTGSITPAAEEAPDAR
jgi:hypothetical protein